MFASRAVAGLSGVVAVSAGGLHSLALLEDGTVYAWGYNGSGELGNGTRLRYAIPARVPHLSGVREILAGKGSAALLHDGTVRVWGEQLSDPAPVRGLDGVRNLVGGWDHHLALLENGELRAWGSNYYGQLGDGTKQNRFRPVAVAGLSNVRAAAAAGRHSLALLEDGSLWAWGQLGDKASVESLVPVRLRDLPDVRSIGAYGSESWAILADGTIRIWSGISEEFQTLPLEGIQAITGASMYRYRFAILKNGSLWKLEEKPVLVEGLRVRAISASYKHHLALLHDGTVWAWGDNECDQVGPPSSASAVGGVVAIADGYDHSLALLADGSVRKWFGGQAPERVFGLPPIARIAAGLWQSIAQTAEGVVWAWGDRPPNTVGHPLRMGEPAPVPELQGVTAFSAGGRHCLALRNDGRMIQWNGWEGKFEEPELTDVKFGTQGDNHALAVLKDGTVWGWGQNDHGQAGAESREEYCLKPVPIQRLSDVQALAAGGSHSLALLSDGSVWRWGKGAERRPVRVTDIADAVAVAAGREHSVVLVRGGRAWIWCCDDPRPCAVSGLSDLKAIAAGEGSFLALRNDGTVRGWTRSGGIATIAGLSNEPPPPPPVPSWSFAPSKTHGDPTLDKRSAELTAHLFLARAADLFASAPVVHVRLTEVKWFFEELLKCEALSKLSALSLVREGLGSEDAVKLASCPYLANLVWLDLSDNAIDEEGVRAIALSPHLQNLRFVNLDCNPGDMRERYGYEYDGTVVSSWFSPRGERLEAEVGGRIEWLHPERYLEPY